MCVELYRQGKQPETPAGMRPRDFQIVLRKWFRMEEACEPEALRNKNQNRAWTATEKYELVANSFHQETNS